MRLHMKLPDIAKMKRAPFRVDDHLVDDNIVLEARSSPWSVLEYSIWSGSACESRLVYASCFPRHITQNLNALTTRPTFAPLVLLISVAHKFIQQVFLPHTLLPSKVIPDSPCYNRYLSHFRDLLVRLIVASIRFAQAYRKSLCMRQ
jgi:hypothetical protein